MAKTYDNFLKWFKEPLHCLYKNDDAGFVILIISLPILERYLRQKSGVYEGKLNSQFYGAFLKMFPSIKNEGIARRFWDVYRNGQRANEKLTAFVELESAIRLFKTSAVRFRVSGALFGRCIPRFDCLALFFRELSVHFLDFFRMRNHLICNCVYKIK